MRDLLNVLIHEKENKISGGIYHRMQIDFAFNSNHIEGSRLTHDQTRYMFETHAIGAENARVNDIIETVNHFKCFNYILDTVSEPFTEEYIKRLHRMLKSGIMVDDDDIIIGEYKRYPNEVGGMETVKPEEVSDKVSKLLLRTENPMKLHDIIEFHVEFERIHPFYDGNGRVGRLIMFKQCLENNIVPFFIDEFHKMFYYMGLKEWQTDGKKERLIDVCLSLQDEMKQVFDYFKIEYDNAELNCKDVISDGK